MHGRPERVRFVATDLARHVARELPVVLGAFLLLVSGAPLGAQIISPGKLSAAHASLDGMTNCTQCHELGKKGASDAKCLCTSRSIVL